MVPYRTHELNARSKAAYDVVVCCGCSHIISHNRVRGHRTGSGHYGAEEFFREKHKQTQGGTRTYHR